MILQALHSLYDRLAQDESAKVPPFGYSTQKIAFAIVLTAEGELVQIADRRDVEGKRRIPIQLTVPGQTKPSGSGVNPCFLWDTTQYLLGYKKDDDKPKRTTGAFVAFRDKHLALKKEIACPAYAAVCQFLEAWKPADAAKHPLLAEVSGGFGVFQILGERRYVQDDPVIQEWWVKHLPTDDDEDTGFCLITGERLPIARLHEPAIKGFPDCPSSSGKLVSFDKSAFRSHGKERGANAPVSILAAFKYCTALNVLTNGARSRQQRIQIGDAATVFWTERASPIEGFFGLVFDAREDTGQNESLRLFLEAARDGKMPGDVDPNLRFYILGLSPNAARLAVRFWHISTVEDVSKKIGGYFRDIQVCKSRDTDPEFPTLQQLLRETAVLRKFDNIPPLLAGAMMRSVLTGLPFPNNLLPVLLDRIRAEQAGEYSNVNYFRACLLKGVLKRNNKLEVSMALDTNNKDKAYLLGRLFAVLERTQAEAINKPNATIRDRFYGSASATPCAVFPVLLRLVQHHVSKAEYGDFRDREIAAILNDVQEFPKRLRMEEQGLFALGYYHQRQYRPTSKPKEE